MNNKNKRRNMNNFKKVGLTALAGSLAAVSANAIELAVSGGTNVSYVSESSKSSTLGGNSIGVDTAIMFNGSGELENGWTVKTYAALNDGGAAALSSSQLTIGMGSLGSLRFAQHYGTAANGIDDVTPKVYEEIWDQGIGSAVLQSFGVKTAQGAMTYTSPAFEVEGFSVSAAVDYDPNADAASNDHDAVTTASTTYGSGTAYVIKGSGMGVSAGAGIETIQGNPGKSDLSNSTAYVLYTMGAASMGIQTYDLNNGNTGGADYTGETYSIAFNVNDNLSVGYQVLKEEKAAVGETVSVEQKMDGLSVAYSMGGMTLAIQQIDVKGANFTSGTTVVDGEELEVNLSFAF
jgi:outer membrane protein OmpU